MVTTARSAQLLSLWRVVTGLGIGGMLAATNAVAAEFANARHRSFCIAVTVIGYPLGAVAGGMVAAHLLTHESWRSVFAFGAIVSGMLLPAIFWGVPESVVWLCEKQPAGGLERINRSLRRLGHATVGALPARPAVPPSPPVIDLFIAGRWRRTVLVTAVYFFHIATFYFILKWVPKIVVDMGFAPSSAAGVLVWANVGGAVGGIALGILSARFGLRPLAVLFLIASTAMVSLFGHGQSTLLELSTVCAVTGFFTNGGVVACYALLARLFPAELRASGTGFGIGVGRGGAALAPIVAGYLFQAGFGLQFIAFAMSAGSLVAAVCVGLLRLPAPGMRRAAENGLEVVRG
jgi:MFS family permease